MCYTFFNHDMKFFGFLFIKKLELFRMGFWHQAVRVEAIVGCLKQRLILWCTFFVWIPVMFMFRRIAAASGSEKMANKDGESEHPCLVSLWSIVMFVHWWLSWPLVMCTKRHPVDTWFTKTQTFLSNILWGGGSMIFISRNNNYLIF